MLIGPEEMLAAAVLLGGHGGVSGGANLFPGLYVELYEAASSGDLATSDGCTAGDADLDEALHSRQLRHGDHQSPEIRTVIARRLPRYDGRAIQSPRGFRARPRRNMFWPSWLIRARALCRQDAVTSESRRTARRIPARFASGQRLCVPRRLTARFFKADNASRQTIRLTDLFRGVLQ